MAETEGVFASRNGGCEKRNKGCESKMSSDRVDCISPRHYKTGGVETIDYIRAKLSKEQYEGYLVGNVIKYISRYRHKNGAEDLKKARVYLNWLIEEMEGNQ